MGLSRYLNKNINLREVAPTSSPNIAHSAWMHGTLWNAIFTSLIGFNNDADFLYRLVTALGMRLNHEYWCKCTWRTNGINKTAGHKWLTLPPLTVGLPVTSERYWASFQVTRLFHKATVSQCDHFFATTYRKLNQVDYQIEIFLPQFGGGALSSNVFTICPYTDLWAAEGISALQTSLLLVTVTNPYLESSSNLWT